MSSGRIGLRYVGAFSGKVASGFPLGKCDNAKVRVRASMSIGVQTGPLFVSSGDLIADRRYQWAIAYLARGDRVGAAEILEQALETAPAFAGAWFALGGIREAQGDRERAIAAFEAAGRADPLDHHGARLRLARLGVGEATPVMMQRHVRRLFDQ